jgi:hypothetical protein
MAQFITAFALEIRVRSRVSIAMPMRERHRVSREGMRVLTKKIQVRAACIEDVLQHEDVAPASAEPRSFLRADQKREEG